MLFSQFWRSKDQKYCKSWTKETVFAYILGFIFFTFLAQVLTYTINIWFNLFVLGSCFKQDDKLNLITWGVYKKRWPKFVHWWRFQRKGLKWKKYRGTGLISEKTEALYAELNERAETATSRYSATDDFLQYNIFIRFIWLLLIIAIIKRWAEGCALQLYRAPLISFHNLTTNCLCILLYVKSVYLRMIQKRDGKKNFS